MPVAPCFFARSAAPRGLVQVKTGPRVRGRTDSSPCRSYISWITVQPSAYFGDCECCARARFITRHETASRPFPKRHRAPLLPEVPPIADGAGADHAHSPRAGIADIRVFQMRPRPRDCGHDRSVEVRRRALAFRVAEAAEVKCRRNT